ncbi:MAG: hypothetical protein ACJASU_000524 [Cognaticolwellia sp.]|jgi:hypothetical protein
MFNNNFTLAPLQATSMENYDFIKQLYYALAVEKTLHFKKTADACNVSQSALSTTIIERNNKQVLITSHLCIDDIRCYCEYCTLLAAQSITRG